MRISDWSSDVCFSDLKEAVDPGQLLLEHLGDAVLDRFGRRAGIGGADIDLRRRDIGILLDRQREERADAAEHDDDRQHPGKDRAVDEKTRHAALSSLRPGAFAFRRADALRAARRDGTDSRALPQRSEEHTSELQSLRRISYAAF